MHSHPLQTEADLLLIRNLIQRLPEGTSVVDFEEKMLTPAVLACTRLWLEGDRAAAFALVDDFNNLMFDVDPAFASESLGNEIVAWGLDCMRRRNAETGESATLDASCEARDYGRAAFFRSYGFQLDDVRSLQYERPLTGDLPQQPLPPGFTLRPVRGEGEVEDLAALHRAAFGSEHMTAEGRLAIMRAPGYLPELDWVVVAASGELAAFCICGFEDETRQVGYTDPIGTHPHYRRLGLARALVCAGLQELQRRGAFTVRLGTSSENLPMQHLAESLGFAVASERLWFSKIVE